MASSLALYTPDREIREITAEQSLRGGQGAFTAGGNWTFPGKGRGKWGTGLPAAPPRTVASCETKKRGREDALGRHKVTVRRLFFKARACGSAAGAANAAPRRSRPTRSRPAWATRARRSSDRRWPGVPELARSPGAGPVSRSRPGVPALPQQLAGRGRPRQGQALSTRSPSAPADSVGRAGRRGSRLADWPVGWAGPREPARLRRACYWPGNKSRAGNTKQDFLFGVHDSMGRLRAIGPCPREAGPRGF